MNTIRLFWHFLSVIILACASSVVLYAKEPPPLFSHTLFSDTFALHDNFQGTYYHTLEENINSLDPNVGTEVYYDFTLPQSVMDTISDTEIDRILFETLMSFSTQEGMEYYSYRRNAYRIFIIESYTVQSLATKEKQLDIKLSDTVMPTEQSFYVYQKDSSFGDGIKHVRVQYDKTNSQFFVNIKYEDKLKYKGVIRIADPDDFAMSFLINRSNNKIQMYGVFAVHTKIFASLRKRMSYSIAYRIYALAQWLEQESIRTLLK